MILSAEEFVNLRRSDDPEEYERAVSEEASEHVWIGVITNYPEMRVWVAENKSVPLSILNILSDDSDPNVRFAVASKRKLDRALFDKLSRDESESVRQRIAYNNKTPTDILRRLVLDSEAIVSNVAKSRLSGGGQ